MVQKSGGVELGVPDQQTHKAPLLITADGKVRLREAQGGISMGVYGE
ncbi:hypothetical protein [Rubritalea tangerina]